MLEGDLRAVDLPDHRAIFQVRESCFFERCVSKPRVAISRAESTYAVPQVALEGRVPSEGLHRGGARHLARDAQNDAARFQHGHPNRGVSVCVK